MRDLIASLQRLDRTGRGPCGMRCASRARGCLLLSDAALPPTDRMVAKYFLIQGDKRSYLTMANIIQC